MKSGQAAANEAAEALKNNAMEVVEVGVVDSLKEAVYNTSIGQMIDDTAAEWIKADSAGMEFVEGIGQTGATIIIGSATGVGVVATAGVVGAGGAIENAWNSIGDDKSSNEKFDAGINAGILSGAWDALQWKIGAKVAGNSVKSVVADVATGALDTFVKTGADILATGKNVVQAFEDQGGWKSVASTAAISGLFSTGAEVLGALKNVVADVPATGIRDISTNAKQNVSVDDMSEIELVKYYNSLLDEGKVSPIYNWRGDELSADDIRVGLKRQETEIKIRDKLLSISENNEIKEKIKRNFKRGKSW